MDRHHDVGHTDPVIDGDRPIKRPQIEWASLDWHKSNCDLARELRVSCETVARQRRLQAGPQRSSIDWTRGDAMLGRYPDAVVAASLGCSTKSVERRRQQRNIPAFSHR